jgi:hypothetical protein
MPCMSYDDRPDYGISEWKSKTDRLARIACKALNELEKIDPDNKLFKNAEASEWWEAHKKADAAAAEARRRAAEAKEKRKAALAKLTDEEKKLLKLT